MTGVAGALASRVQRIVGEVSEAAARSGRDPAAVTVVGVSKTVGRDAVDAAYAAGIRHFGENRVHDAAAKFANPLPDDATLHMIGHLQTNKAAMATRLFAQIDSVDRSSLIAELQKHGQKLNRVIPVLLQVNVAGEQQKAGCAPEAVNHLVPEILNAANLDLRGLMTIAPLVDDAETVRPVFRGLRELRDRLRARHPDRDLPILSMGMSNDFGVAIEEGATHVRIGRALFLG
jgi:pyridoxal phosphate enzyme (YggS family)